MLGDAHADPARLALGLTGIELADGDGAGDVESEANDARIVAIGGEGLAETQARGLHLDLHVFGGIPPVVAVELGHLGVEFALNLGLILLGVGKELLDGNLAFKTEFLQCFI